MPTERPVISSAKRIGITTLISRVTGLVRDMLLVQTFGLGWTLDAFQYAFQFPNLFRRLFGEGALAAAFVPSFAQTIEKHGRESAWALLARTLALLTVALSAVIVIIEAIILIIWMLRGADPLLLSLTALMLPFMLSICLVALFSSILNCVGSFVPAALTPMILNLGMIAGLLWIGPALSRSEPNIQVFGVAISVVVSGALQLVFVGIVMRRHGVRLGWRLDVRDPGVRRVLGLMGPVVLGQGVLVLGVFLDAQVCILLEQKHGAPPTGSLLGVTFEYPLHEGALSAISVAQRLYQFPLGVMGIALATAALPTLSRLAAREHWRDWAGEIRSSLRIAVFGGLLAGAMMLIWAEPIVRVLFQYRSFTADDTDRASRVLACYGLGMWAFFAQHIVLRSFYSVGDVRTPLVISCFLVPANLLASFALVWLEPVREAAFGLSSALTATVNVILGIAILQRRMHAPIADRTMASAVARMAAAALCAAFLVWAARRAALLLFGAAVFGGLAGRVVETFGGLLVGMLAFFGLAGLLRLPEARLILVRVRRGRRRAVAADAGELHDEDAAHRPARGSTPE